MVKISGGDGSSIEKAIRITECLHKEGINEEWELLKNIYGDFRFKQQTLLNMDGVQYDKMEINVNEEIIIVFFDISDFFGKR